MIAKKAGKLSDDELREVVDGCRDGDRDAFRVLYERISPELFRFAVSRMHSRELAFDVLHDTFIDLWSSLHTFEYRGSASFYRFIFTILRRHILRAYKNSNKTVSIADEESLADEMPNYAVSERVVLERAMKKLREIDRSVIELRYWIGLPFSEIATRLGLSETNVKVRHFRSLRTLQAVITDHD